MKVISIIDSRTLYGKERANLNVAHLLKENGFDVIVLYNAIANDEVRSEVGYFRSFEVSFPRRIRGKNRSWLVVKAFFKTISTIKNLLKQEQPDYILIPSEIALSYLYFALYDTKAKVIFRCGDSPIVNRRFGLKKSIYSLLWKSTISRRIDCLVCNAKFIQNQMIESGYQLKKQDIIIYNYPPKRISVSDNVEYIDYERCLNIGFMGRIVPDKGVLELCQTVISLIEGGYHVAVYIAGNPHMNEDYYSMINGILKLHQEASNYIHFIGYIQDIDKFYENTDIVCIPSIYPEPMANVATEAKFHHKPCIIFNHGGLPEIVQHLKSGFICNEVSKDGLLEGIKYYLDNPQKVAEHGENAYNSIDELGLSKEIFTEKWLKVFGIFT